MRVRATVVLRWDRWGHFHCDFVLLCRRMVGMGITAWWRWLRAVIRRRKHVAQRLLRVA